MYEFDGQGSIYDARIILLNSIFFLSTLYTGRRFFIISIFFYLFIYISLIAFVNNMWFAFIAFEHSLQALCLFLFFVFCLSLSSSALVLEPAVLFGRYYFCPCWTCSRWLVGGRRGWQRQQLVASIILSIDVQTQLSSTNSAILCKSSGIMMEHIRAMQVIIFIFLLLTESYLHT